MEAIFVACGAGGPQLKRNPLGSRDTHSMATHSLSFPLQLAVTVLGALVAVATPWWFRSRAIVTLDRAHGSRNRSDWAYALTFWTLAILLGISYTAVGLIPLPVSLALTAGSTFTVLGVLWPPYMHDPAFTSVQLLIQRAVAIAVGLILLLLARSHAG